MAELKFNAVDYNPWQGSQHDSPTTFAMRRWMTYQNTDDDLDFASACELAPLDFEVYEALRKWAWAQDLSVLSLAAQAKLCIAMVRKPPHKSKGTNARRNARLRAIAEALCREYGLKLTRNTSKTSKNECAASILAGLNLPIGEETISGIIRR